MTDLQLIVIGFPNQGSSSPIDYFDTVRRTINLLKDVKTSDDGILFKSEPLFYDESEVKLWKYLPYDNLSGSKYWHYQYAFKSKAYARKCYQLFNSIANVHCVYGRWEDITLPTPHGTWRTNTYLQLKALAATQNSCVCSSSDLFNYGCQC